MRMTIHVNVGHIYLLLMDTHENLEAMLPEQSVIVVRLPQISSIEDQSRKLTFPPWNIEMNSLIVSHFLCTPENHQRLRTNLEGMRFFSLTLT